MRTKRENAPSQSVQRRENSCLANLRVKQVTHDDHPARPWPDHRAKSLLAPECFYKTSISLGHMQELIILYETTLRQNMINQAIS